MAAYAGVKEKRRPDQSGQHTGTRNSDSSVRRREMPGQRTSRRRREQVVIDTQSNRERAQRVTATYAAFILGICIVLVAVGVNFLQLRAQETTYRNTIASMEKELSEKKQENDASYKRIMSAVDLEKIREIAVNELHMDYAKEGQIITYNSQSGDYIRQYKDISNE